MLQEFKEFALKGNVVDLAVGVIIGGAFGKIVESMVADLIMPIVGVITGGIDFSNRFVGLTKDANAASTLEAAKNAGATLAYGNFLTITINFLIVAFVLFLVMKGFNNMKKRMEKQQAAEAAAAPAVDANVALLTEIRDLLKQK